MQVVPTYACGVDCWVWFSHVTAMGSTSIFQAWLLWKEGHIGLGGLPVFLGFILKPVCFGLAFTKTGKPSLPNCLLSSPETRS